MSMGGYGFYVWTAYGLCGVLLLAGVLVPLLRRRQLRAQLRRRQALQQRREQT
ncbi:MAG: heme exporter protein CcmD [Pseudomonadota bacterium]|nr:heme exporter protein CcmD [Pseudomonadota bacterium]HJO36459.1 heme exporter protein CcmD [Gammaproteobacteria bacterium]